MNKTFQVTVGEFEGPLELLLNLIEERKMHISDVSLVRVADDFVQYVREQNAFPAHQAASFIVTAATLLLLKSKALLPVFTLTDEEERDVHDLEHRLNLYKLFRDTARKMGALPGRIYFGGLKQDTSVVFSPAPDMEINALHATLTEVLHQVPTPETRAETVVASVVSLEDMMARLGTRMETALSTTFSAFVGSPEDKREIVVGFLAVLELIKRGSLIAEQMGQYGDIKLDYMGTPSAPRYD